MSRRPTKVEIQPPAMDPTVAPRRNKVAVMKIFLLKENTEVGYNSTHGSKRPPPMSYSNRPVPSPDLRKSGRTRWPRRCRATPLFICKSLKIVWPISNLAEVVTFTLP